ncbi:DUF378 domain-containing protein [Sporosarcina obsidiansis]|uniref:DUF378 domain-containing protein n=1 Tax=Sporosarcina obsidiansis TaxID=2660748 RepID=UPI00129B04A5|nr:DUF378 domain-containing protein [Sporosarcina obsidiansis]
MSMFMRIALALVIIGALNWGLIGFFNFDLVATIFGGQDTLLAKIIYAIVGLSGLATIVLLFRPDEEAEEEHRANRDTFRNVNYNTEFGDEPDFKEIRKKSERENSDSKDEKKF